METAQSTDDRLEHHGSTEVEVATSKSKFGSHDSIPLATSAQSSTTPQQRSLRKSHFSVSDSRLSSAADNVKNPNRTSKSRLRKLDLSLDSGRQRHQGHDASSTTEDEDRTSADEDSAEDDGERLEVRGGEGGKIQLNVSVNSSTSYVDKAVEELVTTERTYVRDLHDVIQVAIRVITIPGTVCHFLNYKNHFILVLIMVIKIFFSVL